MTAKNSSVIVPANETSDYQTFASQLIRAVNTEFNPKRISIEFYPYFERQGFSILQHFRKRWPWSKENREIGRLWLHEVDGADFEKKTFTLWYSVDVDDSFKLLRPIADFVAEVGGATVKMKRWVGVYLGPG